MVLYSIIVLAARQRHVERANEEASFYVGGSTVTSAVLTNSLFGFLASAPCAYQHAPNNQLTLQFVKLLQLFFPPLTLPYSPLTVVSQFLPFNRMGGDVTKKKVNVPVRFCKCSSLDAKYNKVMTF